MPDNIPKAAGITVRKPSPAVISMLGMRSDHTAAATITPEANPNRMRCNVADMASRIRNTKADPNRVPAKGIISESVNPSIIVFSMK